MCKEAGCKMYSPCGKPFELHTVSEIMLDVVWNIIWRLITAAFFLFFFKLWTQNQHFSNRAEIEGYKACYNG